MDGLNFIFDRFAQFNPSYFSLVYGILLLLVRTTHFTLPWDYFTKIKQLIK